MTEWMSFFTDFGFPVAVAFYLLWRIEPMIGKLDRTIQLQTIVIAQMADINLEETARQFGFEDKEVRRSGK